MLAGDEQKDGVNLAVLQFADQVGDTVVHDQVVVVQHQDDPPAREVFDERVGYLRRLDLRFHRCAQTGARLKHRVVGQSLYQ